MTIHYLSGDAADRLAAYEDTNLTPDAAAQLKQIAEIFNCDPNDPAQLKQLCDKLRYWQQAEQAGRLVVLPEGTVSMLMAEFVDDGDNDMVTPVAEARGDRKDLFALLSIAVSAVAQNKHIEYTALLSAMMAHPPLGRLKLEEAEAVAAPERMEDAT